MHYVSETPTPLPLFSNAETILQGLPVDVLRRRLEQERWKREQPLERKPPEVLPVGPVQSLERFDVAPMYVLNEDDGRPLPSQVPESPLEVDESLFDRQEQLAFALEGIGLERKAIRHRNCNRTWNAWSCTACGEKTYTAIATCDLRVCVSCQRRQGKELAAKMRARVESLEQRKGWRLRLLTLTIRTEGQEDMERALDLMGRALPKFWRKVLKVDGAGAMFAMEAGELKGNIHVHGLYWGPWVDQKELSSEWEKLTGGSKVVHVTLARGKGAVAEVCKYVCHPALRVEIQAHLEKALQGKRRIRTYGCFYGCEPTPEDERETRRTCPCCGVVGELELTATTFIAPTRGRGPSPPH